MRDEIDARIWTEHHHQFSEWIATLIARARPATLLVRRLRPLSDKAPSRLREGVGGGVD